VSSGMSCTKNPSAAAVIGVLMIVFPPLTANGGGQLQAAPCGS
jgi:hypothetical protein